MNRMTAEELALLWLLRHALAGETRTPVWEGPAPDWRAVAEIARAHAVLPLLYPVAEGLLPAELYAPAAEKSTRQYYRLLFLTRYYVDLLARQGIATAVLKGAGVAACYPVPEYRKSGDIDLLLLDRAQLTRACAVLRAAGTAETEEQHANHHRSFFTAEGIALELHTTLTEDFDSRWVNDRIAALQKDMAHHIRTCTVMPRVDLPVPDTPYMALSLLLHMLQHFLRAGFGLKLLCDWTVFWNGAVTAEEADHYRRLAEDCGVAGFSDLVTAVCVRYLGLRADCPIAPAADDAQCPALLREVFDAQEFGRTAAQRMVMVRGGHGGYLREFHHQMHLNYPKAGRYVPLWPALWTATLWRFLRNNRRLRNTSLSAVLRETRRRSAILAPLHLFEQR